MVNLLVRILSTTYLATVTILVGFRHASPVLGPACPLSRYPIAHLDRFQLPWTLRFTTTVPIPFYLRTDYISNPLLTTLQISSMKSLSGCQVAPMRYRDLSKQRAGRRRVPHKNRHLKLYHMLSYNSVMPVNSIKQ